MIVCAASNDTYLILEHYIPENLCDEIPIECLIRIRDSRCFDYIPNLENKKVSEYSLNVIKILKWTISKH